ncbi:MAG: hypothetical protein HGA65_09085 [Oscillochloris sp.]|nr:hypothetical protein [Oscillochloris sp.]
MNILRRYLLLLILTTLAAGCTAQHAPSPMPPASFQLVTDPAPLLASLPTAPATAAVPPAPPIDPALLAAWADPHARWQAIARQAAALDGRGAAEIAAELATLDAALADALQLAALARHQGYAVADAAVGAEVAWRLIAAYHPLRADPAQAAADLAAWLPVWQAAESPTAVLYGRLLGAALAQRIIATLPPAV